MEFESLPTDVILLIVGKLIPPPNFDFQLDRYQRDLIVCQGSMLAALAAFSFYEVDYEHVEALIDAVDEELDIVEATINAEGTP